MIRLSEDSTISVVQKAISYFRIPVTEKSIKEALKTHPDFPTLKSISDSLKELNIEHYLLKYQPQELIEISAPYVAHFKTGGGRFAFVTDIIGDKITYYESYNLKKESDIKEYIEKCSGVIILFNPEKSSGEKDYREKRQEEIIGNSIIPFLIIFISILIVIPSIHSFSKSIITGNYRIGLLFITKISGIFLSLLLIFKELGIQSTLTDRFCYVNKTINCNAVLFDKRSRIFRWFTWADVGFIYFVGSVFLLLRGSISSDLSYLFIISTLTLPFPIFSIYYQGFVLRKWCLICVGVQMILLIEFILLFTFSTLLSFSFISLFDVVLVFLITGIIHALVMLNIKVKHSNEENYFKYLKFKRNPDIIRAIIQAQKQFEIPLTDTSLVLGKRDALFNVTVFLKLPCFHCIYTIDKIKEILEIENKIAINIILLNSDTGLLNALYHLIKFNKYKEALNLLEKWYKLDSDSREKVIKDLGIPFLSEVAEEIYDNNINLFKSCDVISTPAVFTNGYLLPNQYDVGDIKYFSEVFTNK